MFVFYDSPADVDPPKIEKRGIRDGIGLVKIGYKKVYNAIV